MNFSLNLSKGQLNVPAWVWRIAWRKKRIFAACKNCKRMDDRQDIRMDMAGHERKRRIAFVSEPTSGFTKKSI